MRKANPPAKKAGTGRIRKNLIKRLSLYLTQYYICLTISKQKRKRKKSQWPTFLLLLLRQNYNNMTTQCDICKGEGLVGAGPEPHLKQGEISTCTNCSGTGQVGEVTATAPVDTTSEQTATDTDTNETGSTDSNLP